MIKKQQMIVNITHRLAILKPLYIVASLLRFAFKELTS